MFLGGEGAMLLSVLYKLPREPKPHRADWIVKDLAELMQRLARDGVTTETVEYLYVHYSPTGTTNVLELVAVDNSTTKAPTGEQPTTSAIILPFQKKEEAKTANKKTAKPRVRLKASADSAPIIRSYLYSAKQV